MMTPMFPPPRSEDGEDSRGSLRRWNKKKGRVGEEGLKQEGQGGEGVLGREGQGEEGAGQGREVARNRRNRCV